MSGDAKRGRGRPKGALNTRTEDLQKRFVELSNEEMFTSVFLSLVDVATNGDRGADRVNAAKYLIDRWLGKVAERLEVTESSQSVGDILAKLRPSAPQNGAQTATGHSSDSTEEQQ